MQIPGEKCREKPVGDSLALTSEVDASEHFCYAQLPGLQVRTVSPHGITPKQPFWGSLGAAGEHGGNPTGDARGAPKAPPGAAKRAAGTSAGKGPAGATLQEDTALRPHFWLLPSSSEPDPLPSQETSRSCPGLQFASSPGNGVGAPLLPP